MPRTLLLLAFLTVLCGCRNADGSGPATTKFIPSTTGAHGCVGPDAAFSGAPGLVDIGAPLGLTIAPAGGIAASAAAELLWVTTADGVVEIDVSGPAPSATVLATSAAVDMFLQSIGAAVPAQLSGIAVLPGPVLVIAELSNNFLLAVDTTQGNLLVPFAGEPNPAPGFADGPGLAGPPLARFAFDRPIQLAATGGPEPRILIPDPGNHAIREWTCGGDPAACRAAGFVRTLVGIGSAFYADDDLFASGFDTPVAVAVTCSGNLLVAETGAVGAGGNRVRMIILGPVSFFGQEGAVTTFVGDGVPDSREGDGQAASAAGPGSVLSTGAEDVYWVDSLTGVLRRATGSAAASDCPLFADCATAVAAGGTFAAGGLHGLTQTPAGRLFVLDWDAGGGLGTLWELTP